MSEFAAQTAQQKGQVNAPGDKILQRKCACGQHSQAGDENAEGKKKRFSLQRHAALRSEPATIPDIVHEVLNSPGQPLSADTRTFMESRFDHDFSRVRVHTDSRAQESARAVNALAYTVGPHVVFGASQFTPTTSEGRKLIAHELTHVVQQNNGGGLPRGVSSPSDPLELAADNMAESFAKSESGFASPGQVSQSHSSPRLMRRVAARLTHCPPNTHGAPADPEAELRANDTQAENIATQLSQSFANDARAALNGIPDPMSDTFQSYQDHFGLPGPEGSGFLNRLTGVVRPTQAVAMNEELNILSRRFALVARLYRDFMNYVCVETEGVQFGGCESGPCDQGDAWSCRGVGVVFLCPSFWTDYDSGGRAGILLHEAMHIILGPTDPRQVGQIGDETLRGPGRNFNIAGCYEAITNEIAGIDSHFECPAPP